MVQTYDARQVECRVFTYKEGLLSPVAHDLLLRVTALEVTVDLAARTIRARFDPASVRAVCAVRHGREAPDVLSPKDLRDIDRNTDREVLESRRHPELRFESTEVVPEGSGWRVRGTLQLHGHRRPVDVPVRRVGDRLVARVRLHQPDFGIRPFSALMGTMKVKPDVEVEISAPVPEGLPTP